MDCMVLYVLAPLHERLDSSKSFRCWTFRFDNAIRTEVTTILMPSWATRVAIEKVWGRCFSSRSPNNLDGIEVNPFASSYLVGRLKWVDSLVGSNPSSSFMFITPCPDHQIQFYVNIKLDLGKQCHSSPTQSKSGLHDTPPYSSTVQCMGAVSYR